MWLYPCSHVSRNPARMKVGDSGCLNLEPATRICGGEDEFGLVTQVSFVDVSRPVCICAWARTWMDPFQP